MIRLLDMRNIEFPVKMRMQFPLLHLLMQFLHRFLTLHYLGLLRIEFQAAFFKAAGQNFFQIFRLRLAHTMTYLR